MKENTLLLLAASLLLLFSCNSEQKAERAAIQAQEAKVEENASPENAQALLQLYQDYRGQYPGDDEYNARYFYREAALQYRMNQFEKAAASLYDGLQQYPDSEVSPRLAYMLGDIYREQLYSPETAVTIYQTMQQAFPDDSLTVKARAVIPAEAVALEQRLTDLRSSIFADSTGRIDYRKANAYIKSSALVALLLPDAENTPDLLYQAGEIARAIRDHEQALQFYAMLHERYPRHKHAPKALFMQAFTYDDNLKQFDKARATYEAFLSQYPNDDFADDAQVLLDNLGKNDEEIINNLTKKGQQEGKE